MCGIHGLYSLNGSRPDPSLVERMGDITAHRGPDDHGYHADGPCIIGMRRLSIIDLSGGHQPISNADDTLWVVCNGEIYNFRELRVELQQAGHRFKTASDSEVVLHAYAQWGDDFVLRLNGMFAFALWDAVKRRLIVGRDRLGIKPIYWSVDGGRLAFSTEAKAITALPGFSARVDPVSLRSYVQLGYVSAPRSMFQGIEKLPPATLLIAQDGRVETRRYWRIKPDINRALSEADWVDMIRDKLQSAVRMQMVSDVPIGAFLSGGIDSSAVVALMARESQLPIKTYAIGFGGGAADNFYNELPYARRVAELFGTDHHEIVVKPDVVKLLPKLIWHMDEPIADTAFITTYLVSEFARRDVKVILSGVGGDELFGGYRRYLGGYYANKFAALPGWLKWSARKIGRLLPADRHSGMLNSMRLAKGFLASAEQDFESRYSAYMNVIPPELARQLLPAGQGDGVSPVLEALRNIDGDDGLNRMFAVDAETQLPDDLLLLTDKMSMATSLECRVPLLDHELVEMAASIPEDAKVKGGELKHLLKRAMSGILPDDILHRKKRGFGTPMGAWLKNDLSGLLADTLSAESLRRRGYIEPTVVRDLIRAHERNQEDYTDILLALMNFEVWARIYLDGRAATDVSDELSMAVA